MLQQTDRKKLTASVFRDFVLIETLRLKPRVTFIIFIPVKRFDRLTEEDIERVVRRELEELRSSYIQEIGFTVIDMWECDKVRLHKTSNNVKKYPRKFSLQTFTCS